ncbi:hypothetical protein [Streptomyces sp. NPDC048442]|uniref:hypothetical protein n=1 Tax=Streptomyces sp. NPDC048442 TaxID=3154823 RepID=UPI003433B821
MGALAGAQRSASGRTSPEHLAVLLDVPRQDLGPARSARCDAAHSAFQQIRSEYIAPSFPTTIEEPSPAGT